MLSIDDVDMNFAQVTPAPVKAAATVKIGVQKNNGIRISLNQAAMKKIDNPGFVTVRCAEKDGQCFIKIRTCDGDEKTGFTVNRPRKAGGYFYIHDHPFDPGVTHGGEFCNFKVSGNEMLIQCPDWDEMLGAAEAAEEEGAE